MEKYVANLIGESDGHVVSREFGDVPSAIAWLKGAGLAEFEDQTTRGEVRSSDGDIKWQKSHLQTAELAERYKTLDWKRFFARHNITFKRKKG